MAWETVQYRLTSSAPLIMHNGQTADPRNSFAKELKQLSGKRKKTDADYEEMAHIEFLAGLYMDSNGPVIPSYVMDAVVIGAAKKSREGQTAKSGCFCPDHATLEYDGPRTAEELWADELFRFSSLVRIRSARISRMRPIFNEWATTVTIEYDDTLINLRQIDDWMQVAGTQVGLCDWRPKYGRFTVERLNGK